MLLFVSLDISFPYPLQNEDADGVDVTDLVPFNSDAVSKSISLTLRL